MKIMVLNIPPNVQREECCWGPLGKWKAFPFLLAHIVTVLEKEVDVGFFDANCENATLKDVETMLSKEKPDAIVCSLTPQYMPLEAKISNFCVKNGIQCICIPIPFDSAEKVVQKYDFHFAIYSEPEKTLIDWCRGTNLENLRGIAYKTGKKVIKNPPQQLYFSRCPPINWDRFDLKKYDSISYQIARGCPYGCVFCVWANKPWQLKPIETVLTDLANLERRGIWSVYLLCAQITTDKKWLYSFCREKIERGIRILWRSDIRANEVTRESIRLMRDAGCVGLYMGVESFNQKILNKINKKLTVDQILNAIRICIAEGIPLTFPIMFNIGESEKEIIEYIRFIKEIKIPFINSGIVKAYVGTKLYNEIVSINSPYILDMGVVPILTNKDLLNAQRNLMLFRKEKKKLFPLRAVCKLWWLVTNRGRRRVFLSILGRVGIRKSIRSIFFSIVNLYHK